MQSIRAVERGGPCADKGGRRGGGVGDWFGLIGHCLLLVTLPNALFKHSFVTLLRFGNSRPHSSLLTPLPVIYSADVHSVSTPCERVITKPALLFIMLRSMVEFARVLSSIRLGPFAFLPGEKLPLAVTPLASFRRPLPYLPISLYTCLPIPICSIFHVYTPYMYVIY